MNINKIQSGRTGENIKSIRSNWDKIFKGSPDINHHLKKIDGNNIIFLHHMAAFQFDWEAYRIEMMQKLHSQCSLVPQKSDS